MRGVFWQYFFFVCWKVRLFADSSRNWGHWDDDILLFPLVSSYSSSYYDIFLFGGQLVDLLAQLIQEMKEVTAYTRDRITIDLVNCAQVYLRLYFTGSYKYQLENRHPYLLMEFDFGNMRKFFMLYLPFRRGQIWMKILWECISWSNM